jgi:hypothetical protein
MSEASGPDVPKVAQDVNDQISEMKKKKRPAVGG